MIELVKLKKRVLTLAMSLLLLITYVMPVNATSVSTTSSNDEVSIQYGKLGLKAIPSDKPLLESDFLQILDSLFELTGATAPHMTSADGSILLREEAAKYISKALKLTDIPGSFKDIPANSVYSGSIGAIVKTDIMKGYNVNVFGYGKELTGKQAAAIFVRIYEFLQPFKIVEATITDMQKAMETGKITSHQLVQMYLDRIAKYDDQGPAINAITTLNPKALDTADQLDKERQTKGPRGPLHGIPIIVKENYDTFDMQTTAGSASLAGSIPPDDAYMVAKLREAGAIIIAKSNMAEFAFSALETVSSLGGITHNPYALDRVPAGSSGGTGASIAANFAAAGLGTDTGNSIRGPSSHNSLVGIRPTIGLTSRDGIIPLNLARDVGGPMARTVTDAAILLDAFAGYDPKDPVTASSIGHVPDTYTSYLKKDGLKGVRIGVLREFIDTPTIDPEVKRLMEQSIKDLEKQGAVIVDPFVIPNLADIRSKATGGSPFEYELNEYLKTLGPDAKMKSLDDIIASGKFDPSIKDRMLTNQKADGAPFDDPAYLKGEYYRQQYRIAVLKAMADYNVDAIIYPTWNNPPRLIGDMTSPDGNNSGLMSPPTGFPALTVPMGFSYDKYPAGLQMLGRPFTEGLLIQYAYAYEQATLHRHAPDSTP
jgi:amidase